jgi:hypothetical protein
MKMTSFNARQTNVFFSRSSTFFKVNHIRLSTFEYSAVVPDIRNNQTPTLFLLNIQDGYLESS